MRIWKAVATTLGCAIGLLGLAAPAGAAAPEFLLQIPERSTSPGSGAGQIDNPQGIAGDPSTGYVYVADRRNARVSVYTAWGLFVGAWGWNVAPEGTPGDTASDGLEFCGSVEPAAVPDASLCQKGAVGEDSGQMGLLLGGVAVDAESNVWVGDLENLRVQKFSATGEFLLLVGGDVNRTKVEAGAPAAQRNLCPVDPGDVCQKGTAGDAPGQLTGTVGDVIAYSVTDDAILVGDTDGIQVFDLDGSFREEIAFTGALAPFAGMTVNGLDLDPDGNVYFSLAGQDDVYKLGTGGEPLAPGMPGASSFEVNDPQGVAVDVNGNVYVIEDPFPGEARILIFDPSGDRLVPTEAEEKEAMFFPYIPFLGPVITAIATNVCVGSAPPGNLYVSFFEFEDVAYLNAYGSAPLGCEPPPKRLPTVIDQFASSVGDDEATLRAQINPRFWADTTYYVEYGTGDCSTGGCPFKAPLSPLALTSKSVNSPLATSPIALEGLSPATTYNFRFVAESSGGGPAFGIDPDGSGPLEANVVSGLEGSFNTRPAPETPPACPNDAFRLGAALRLPDCRAYELVSPLEKGNADIAPWIGRNNQLPHMAEIHISAPTADRFTFSSATAFGDAQAASFASQYFAERGSGGWTSRSLMPPRTESPVGTESLLTNEFQGFSADLCRSWLRHYSVAPLAPGAIAGYANVYRRENCIQPAAYTALSPAKPTNRSPERYFGVRTQGFSVDGSHAIFTANGKLEGTGAPNLVGELDLLLYEHSPAGLRFVCLQPNGNPISQSCAAGLPGGTSGSQSSTRNAISADGSRIFWTAYTGALPVGFLPEIPGQIYVRIDGQKTVAVSGSKSPSPAIYWTAADDGSKVVFEFASGPLADQLYEFDVDTKTARLIAGGVEGPLGASEDASRLYFASSQDLDGGGPADAGGHNLYLYEADPSGGAGTYIFVMGLAGGDIGGTDVVPAPVDPVPSQRSARVSPDGLHAVFTSEIGPTPDGYDNTDAEGGAPAQEVYLYDAVDDQLRCVSCNPTGARPTGQDIGGGFSFWIAARIQGWEANNHAPRVLSDDGSRVFFESHEALSPDDVNGTWDVYQWEEPGKGTCTTKRGAYSEVSGGCVHLISAGQSPTKSTFLDADPSGESIFFSTQSSLVPSDYGLNDVYVARVGGGFPEPVPPPDCVPANCQSPPPPPEVTPASEIYRATPKAKAHKCPKGKRRLVRKGKVRCVKKKRRGAKTGSRKQAQRKGGQR